MKVSENSKWILFAALLVLILLSVYSSYQSRPAAATLTPAHRQQRTSVPTGTEGPFLQMLSAERPLVQDVKRNVFHFGDEDAQEDLASAPRIAIPPVVTAPPAVPDVRYLGFYKQKDDSKIQLAAISNGGQIYVGGVGEILGGKYEVIEIEDEFLVLRVLATNQIMRFELGNREKNP